MEIFGIMIRKVKRNRSGRFVPTQMKRGGSTPTYLEQQQHRKERFALIMFVSGIVTATVVIKLYQLIWGVCK